MALDNLIALRFSPFRMKTFYLYKIWANWDAIRREIIAQGDESAMNAKRDELTEAGAKAFRYGTFYKVTAEKLTGFESLGGNSRCANARDDFARG